MHRVRLLARFCPLLLCLAIVLPTPAQAEPNRAPFPSRWIDVNLTTLRATAYEGEKPVHVAPVTSGKPGWETVTGTFYVRYRVASETMDSMTIGVPHDSPEGYLLKNVLYTQYFTGEGDAIHSNYWQPEWVFGQANTSHGCVGMRTSDAGFFWSFANVGTPIVIHRGPSGVAVDNVIGQPVAEAKARLEQAGFQVAIAEAASDKPAGTVLSQLPLGGASAPKGSAIALTVAGRVATAPAQTTPATPAPARPPSVQITATPTAIPAPSHPAHGGARKPEGNRAWTPNVVGLPEAEARKRIEDAGLTNTYTNYQTEADIPEANRAVFRATAAGSVLSASPLAGTEVLKGSPVRIAVRKQ
jgi:hypothetical protein